MGVGRLAVTEKELAVEGLFSAKVHMAAVPK
jgi:hypothetical protein